MNKKDLMNITLTNKQAKNADVALSVDFVKALEALNIEDNVINSFVWCYDKNILGRPVLLSDKYYHMYKNAHNLFDVSNNVLKWLKEHKSTIRKTSLFKKFENEIKFSNYIYDFLMPVEDLVEKHKDFYKSETVPSKDKIPEDQYNAILIDILCHCNVKDIIAIPGILDMVRKAYHDKIVKKYNDINKK